LCSEESATAISRDDRGQMKMGGWWDSIVVLTVIGAVLFFVAIEVLSNVL
jgi:hypothetical protein